MTVSLLPMQVHNFPFPTPPDPEALRSAHRCLEALAALEPKSGALTAVGRAMAAFPISPRHARMLLEVSNGVLAVYYFYLAVAAKLLRASRQRAHV